MPSEELEDGHGEVGHCGARTQKAAWVCWGRRGDHVAET